jgi:replication factor A1
MLRSKIESYAIVKNLFSKREFDKEIKKRYDEFGGMFNEDAIAALIVDEYGRNLEVEEKTDNIGHLKSGQDVTLSAKVVKIYPLRKFTRKNGETGMVATIDISDSTGTSKLVLWSNHDVDMVKSGRIFEGSEIKIINGSVKESTFGTEITMGKWSLLKIIGEDAGSHKERTSPRADSSFSSNGKFIKNSESSVKNLKFSPLDNLAPSTSVNIKGVVVQTTPVRSFKRKDDTTGHVLNISIHDGLGQVRVVLWDKSAVDFQNTEMGDQFQIINAFTKEIKGNIEVHSTEDSEITVGKQQETRG